MKKIYLLPLLLLIFACNSTSENFNEPMPSQPDYTQSDMWYTNVDTTPSNDVDIFYILPTCVFSWSDSSGTIYNYADVNNQEQRAAMLYSYQLAEEIFGENNNFYAPYYRQITLNVWQEGEGSVAALFPAAMEDIDDAFDNFIDNKNSDRPFIIAGFSQGGKGVVELVKGLSEDKLSRMVAAYVIGYKVTNEDLENSNIQGAVNAEDSGITICYNSVENIDAINPLISDSQLCINPVNWTTLSTPAQLNDSVTVSVNTTYNVLIVDGLNSEELYIEELSELFKEGNYHLQELELYKEHLKENVDDRINAFLKR
ncbi:MAG: DUF3089 domain-containing protein [Rikenellaceae bacterium]